LPHTEKTLLHIASFDGNIGDNASHNGFYRQLRENTGWKLSLDQREIRKTYLNYEGTDRWSWGDDLIRDMNNSDLTVIGGGNYFELWLENSATGTTIDLDPERLQDIKKPFFFHAVGCDPNIGVSDKTISRFRYFIETAVNHPLCVMSVRNDGSMKYLQRFLGDTLADRILVTPDPGFFVDPGTTKPPAPIEGKTYWVLNLAMDRPERRFPGTNGKLDYSGFLAEIAVFIQQACETYPALEIVLAPHIYSDLDPIRDVIAILPDRIRRWRVSVAPLLHGMGAEKTLFALYRDAELALGPRFHANVCPIGLGTPSIGLVTTEKLVDLYDELGMPDRIIDTQTPGFSNALLQLARATIKSDIQIRADYAALRETLSNQSSAVYQTVGRLVDQ
jgi:polysaccharide pyruvyl transferase WcaK-like protein